MEVYALRRVCMYDDVLTRFTNGCLANELDRRLSQEVLAPLPANPTMEEWEDPPHFWLA